MLIQAHASGLALDSEMRRTIEEKLSASFARFKDAIEKIQVNLADENGPKKGIDKFLRLSIHVEHQPVIIIEEKGKTGWRCSAASRIALCIRCNGSRSERVKSVDAPVWRGRC